MTQRQSESHVMVFRITLMHWLWWLTITAVLLAIHREDMVVSENLRTMPGAENVVRHMQIGGAANLLVCPFHALAIWSVGLLVWRMWCGCEVFPAAPGHWLLVCLGTYILGREIVGTAVEILIWSPWFSITDNENTLHRTMLVGEWVSVANVGLTLAMLIAAAWTLREPLRWRIVFPLAGIAAVFFMAVDVRMGLYGFSEVEMWLERITELLLLLAGLTAAVAAIMDVARRRSRDLMHWLGVATVLASMVPTIVLESGRWQAF